MLPGLRCCQPGNGGGSSLTQLGPGDRGGEEDQVLQLCPPGRTKTKPLVTKSLSGPHTACSQPEEWKSGSPGWALRKPLS